MTALVMPGDRLEQRSIRLDGSETGWDYSPSGLVLPASALPDPEPTFPTCISTFSGAGGMDLGMHMAGFHVVVASDFNRDAMLTYLTNLSSPSTVVVPLDNLRATQRSPGLREGQPVLAGDIWPDTGTAWISHASCTIDECVTGPGTTHRRVNGDAVDGDIPSHDRACEVYFFGDIRKLTANLIAEFVPSIDEWDLLVGGPPCQGFSVAGKRNVMDPRNSLVFEWARLVCDVQPRAFVMENVPGIASMVTPEGQPVLDALAWMMADGGWSDYEAVRRAMQASVGGPAALRGGKKPPKVVKDAAESVAEPDPEGAQLGLDLAGIS